MSDDYLWDRSGTPDRDVAGLEALLSPLAHDAPFAELRARRPRVKAAILIGVLAAAAVLVLVLVLVLA